MTSSYEEWVAARHAILKAAVDESNRKLRANNVCLARAIRAQANHLALIWKINPSAIDGLELIL